MQSVQCLIRVGLILAMVGIGGNASWMVGAQDGTHVATSDLLDGYVAALNAHDAEDAARFYAEDAVVTQAVHEGNTFTGRDQIAGWIGDNLGGLPDLDVAVVGVVEEDDRLAWEWIYRGTYTGQFPGVPDGSGQPVELRGASVMEMQDGKIVRETLYYDNLAFLTQIGAMDGATPAAD